MTFGFLKSNLQLYDVDLIFVLVFHIQIFSLAAKRPEWFRFVKQFVHSNNIAAMILRCTWKEFNSFNCCFSLCFWFSALVELLKYLIKFHFAVFNLRRILDGWGVTASLVTVRFFICSIHRLKWLLRRRSQTELGNWV